MNNRPRASRSWLKRTGKGMTTGATVALPRTQHTYSDIRTQSRSRRRLAAWQTFGRPLCEPAGERLEVFECEFVCKKKPHTKFIAVATAQAAQCKSCAPNKNHTCAIAYTRIKKSAKSANAGLNMQLKHDIMSANFCMHIWLGAVAYKFAAKSAMLPMMRVPGRMGFSISHSNTSRRSPAGSQSGRPKVCQAARRRLERD